MGRPVVLSNGQLFVGLDESGLVHDFYYPYVGLEDLTNARSTQHKIGVWVDGRFSWTNDGSWLVSVAFLPETLISNITLESSDLQIKLVLHDFVDTEYNAFVRRISVTNLADQERDVRLFMHQVFQLSNAGRADTALYVPDGHYLLDYKGRHCLVIGGKFSDDDAVFDQYSVGNYGIEGKAGTFMDAEDGELTGNPVEHGGVDSVIRFQRRLGPHDSYQVDYWIVAANNQNDGAAAHDVFNAASFTDRERHVSQHWQEWLQPSAEKLQRLPDDQKQALQHSLLIIKAHCDERGSVLASGDSTIFNYGRDYYCYCWPRDASYALWPLIRLGHYDEAKAFFAFARDTMHKDGYLLHKYQPDRAIGSTWHPLIHGRNKDLAIQEDETASVVFMLYEYYKASHDVVLIENFYRTFIAPCADFMTRFIDKATGLPHASYDLWEQKFLTSTYTVCTVIAGLESAANLAKVLEYPDDAARWQQSAAAIRSKLDVLYRPDGFFCKGFLLQPDGEIAYDDTLDISNLYGPYMYGGIPLDDERLLSTANHVQERLADTSPIGGVIRYPGDDYFLAKRQYGGNPWIVCSLWLAQYYIGNKQNDKAEPYIAWALARQMPSGVLSEQFDPDDGTPMSVAPLVWSHAEMVNTILDLHQL